MRSHAPRPLFCRCLCSYSRLCLSPVNPQRNPVISTEAAHSLIVSSAAEKPASLHAVPQPRHLALVGYPSVAVVVLVSPPRRGPAFIAYRAVERPRIFLCSLLSAFILLIIVTPLSVFIRARQRSPFFGSLKVLTELGTDFCYPRQNGSIR